MRRWVLTILAELLNRNYTTKRYNFPAHPTALPCKTVNTEITSFYLNVVCCFANKRTQEAQLSPSDRAMRRVN